MEPSTIAYIILQSILGIAGIILIIYIIKISNENRRLYLFKVIPKDNKDAWYITTGRLK